MEHLLVTIHDQLLGQEEHRHILTNPLRGLAKDLPKLQHTIKLDRRQVVVQTRTTPKMVTVKNECIDPFKYDEKHVKQPLIFCFLLFENILF